MEGKGDRAADIPSAILDFDLGKDRQRPVSPAGQGREFEGFQGFPVLQKAGLAWIACCCLASMALARFIIFWALWPMYPRSTGPAPYFFSSIRSDQTEVCRAAFRRRAMSFWSPSFWACSKACCRLKFSSQVEKVPFCTVMLARLRDRMWSTQPSKK